MKKIKDLDKALQLFCATNKNKLRPYFLKPFLNKGRIMATDAKMLISVDPRLLETVYEEHDIPRYNIPVKDMSKRIQLKTIEYAFENIEKVPEKKSNGEEKECAECGGIGYVSWEFTDSLLHTHYMEDDCPVCDGTGINKEYEEIETGNMIISENAVFVIDGISFNVHLWRRIVDAMSIIGVDSIVWSHVDPIGVNIFDVCDGIEIHLMPYMADDDTSKVYIPLSE